MSDGFDAVAFAAKMSSIGHAGGAGGGGGHEEHTFQVGIDGMHWQELIDTAMAGHPGSYLFVKGLIEAGILPPFNILEQASFIFKIMPPTTLPLLPHPGTSLVSQSR